MLREKLKWRPHESESTDAEHRGGAEPVVVMKSLYWRWSEGAALSGFIDETTRNGRILLDKAKPLIKKAGQ